MSLAASLSDQHKLLDGTKGCVVLRVDDEFDALKFQRQHCRAWRFAGEEWLILLRTHCHFSQYHFLNSRWEIQDG